MNEKYAKPYFESFMVALSLSLLPIKIFSYVVPFVALFWFIVRSSSGRVLQRTLMAITGIVVLLGFYYIIYLYQGTSFLLGNSVVAIFTYSTFFLLLVIPGRGISSSFSYEKYAPVLKWVILIEGIIGILQFVIVTVTGITYIINGDSVQGTIGIDAILNGNAGFGNQIFVISMIFFIFLFIPYVLQQHKYYYVVLVGLLSIMLAGVLHVFVSLVWALLFTILFYRKNLIFSDLSKIIGGVAMALLMLLPLEFFFPGISKTTAVFFQIYQDRDSPKFEAMDNAFDKLPEQYPLVSLIGLGPGQYSSRAGLISSGNYYGSKMNFLPNEVSEPFRKLFQHTWLEYTHGSDRYGNSTMHRPFFSILSLFAEFGFVGLGLFLGCILYFFMKIRLLFVFFKERKNKVNTYLAFAMGVLLIMLVFISTFENYLETVQALLPGMMLFKVLYSQLLTEAKQKPQEELVQKELVSA
ncbi:hypothetical protein QNI16_31130 [Cytophagaceae bacterium YF14B1]|uniref:O-antigen ligase domain-containing protein n=1 Tax=Xanthocytophaga flava TaxID=3048013 RepID=A0AAE3U9E0_9BACT|nr:hypothetical protein [Xanthocytophaga flavus]MDJ1484994.1 hypothetical protein [Xanthocytophaga flavus]